MVNHLIVGRRSSPFSSSTMVDWSKLPYDLVVSIANQLFEVEDFLSFSTVCRCWRLVYLKKHWIPNHHIPWLMLGEYTEGDVSIRQFLSLTRFKIYKFPLPEANGCRCWGTSHGWIVTLSQSFAIRLVNPLTRACLDLPHHSMLRSQGDIEVDWFAAIQKAVVLKVRDDFVTMVIYRYNRCLSFAKYGDGAWTVVPFSNLVYLVNIVCFKDRVLVLTMVGTLILIEMEGPDGPRARCIASPPGDERGWENMYLVESSESLLLVLHYNHRSTHRFKVYKFDIFKRKWMAAVDLGNNVLLIDNYGCTSVSACGSIKPNCIYFAQDNLGSSVVPQQELKMIVFNIKDNRTDVQRLNASSFYDCPVWTTPALR
ncbi:F-box protein SKIP23-like isoform X2 [Olea europaea var. sylvestris]|uniref:F-box protein SKIP23-like isoform X2 n=1 Tax=Olea europaea var. sylvestris TaxID=158386 RepID=UPI000C1D2FB4|nr:F-box protein SKIP23-like isoform X2 [Olea europaea var. sylvestris]